jgi:hypothetical protein
LKSKLTEFLKPTKGKIAVAILTPHAYNLFLYSILFLISLKEIVGGMPDFGEWAVLTISEAHIHLIVSVIYYPFACGVVILRSKGRKELQKDKELYRLVKIGIFIFNPLILEMLVRFILVWGTLLYYKGPPPTPGLTVIEVYPNSSAMDIGLENGDRIKRIGYSRREWTGNAMIVAKQVSKESPSISDAREILEYVDPNDPADEIYVHLYSGGGSRVGHVSTNPFGIRVRDVNGTEAVL